MYVHYLTGLKSLKKFQYWKQRDDFLKKTVKIISSSSCPPPSENLKQSENKDQEKRTTTTAAHEVAAQTLSKTACSTSSSSSPAQQQVHVQQQVPHVQVQPVQQQPSAIIQHYKGTIKEIKGELKLVKKVVPKNRMLSAWKSRDGERDKWRLRDVDGYRIRAAALCLKGTGTDARVLLVSGGKDGAKWVVPGGGVEKDEGAEEAAHRELMEEAGVRATTLKNIGMFQDDVRKHKTQVFLMEVEEELQTWEENEYGRQRIWMPLLEGAEKVKQNHRAMIEAILTR